MVCLLLLLLLFFQNYPPPPVEKQKKKKKKRAPPFLKSWIRHWSKYMNLEKLKQIEQPYVHKV